MCLATYKTEPSIADKDITVYKILTKNFRAPYMNNLTYKLGMTYQTEIKKGLDSFFSEEFDGEFYRDEYDDIKDDVMFYGQGFHSCKVKTIAIKEKWNFHIIVKCTIPKGSKYIVSEVGLVISDTIRIDKIV